MSRQLAVVHYPEGAGHATRMMGVARALEVRGATVSLAGGGDGRFLYGPNGYDAYCPPRVNYVEDYQGQDGDDGPLRGLAATLTRSVPQTARRLRAITGWLRRTDPDAVVADDGLAVVAAARAGLPTYAVTHDAAAIYHDPVVRAGVRAVNAAQYRLARRLFCPVVWPPTGEDVPGASRVPPIALPPPDDPRSDDATDGDSTDGDPVDDASADDGPTTEDPDAADGPTDDAPADDGPTDDDPDAGDAGRRYGPADPGVVVVPSAYSRGLETATERLRAAGHRVTVVGDHDWGPVPSLLPVLERATAVVCSGYSTVMEAAVAGTHCVVCAATNEQAGVARRLLDVEGFTVARSPDEVVAAVGADRPAPEYANGIAAVAERVLDDIGRLGV